MPIFSQHCEIWPTQKNSRIDFDKGEANKCTNIHRDEFFLCEFAGILTERKSSFTIEEESPVENRGSVVSEYVSSYVSKVKHLKRFPVLYRSCMFLIRSAKMLFISGFCYRCLRLVIYVLFVEKDAKIFLVTYVGSLSSGI